MKTLGLILSSMIILGASGCSSASSTHRDGKREPTTTARKPQQRSVEGTIVAVGEVWSGGKKEIVLELEERLGMYYYAPRTCTARVGDRVVINYTYRRDVRTATSVAILPPKDHRPRR